MWWRKERTWHDYRLRTAGWFNGWQIRTPRGVIFGLKHPQWDWSED